MLRWAREKSGHSIDDIAQHLKKDVAVIESWEAGESAPTYVQLEKLAYTYYKRPLALFFFPEPPIEPDPSKSFRSLPDFEVEAFAADTRYALRQARAMQVSLSELCDGVNPADQKIFHDIHLQARSVVKATIQVRRYLDVSLTQQSSWKSTEDALKNWRERIQDKGLFIFKRSFRQKDLSAFCLPDPHHEFPIIYLNNSTAPARQIFSIFHELAHLLLGVGGVTKSDDSFIDFLTGDPRRIEVFCNVFAAEFLVPSEDFKQFLSHDFCDDRAVARIASRYNVSREVILRKALDKNLVDEQHYREKAAQWAKEYKQSRGKRSGGSYYPTQATYLGGKFLDLAFGRYYQGRCSMEQLADYLNVRVRSIRDLEQFALSNIPAQ